MRALLLSVCLLLAAINSGNISAIVKPDVIDGYPIANFALTVNASETGDFYGKIMQNPGKLGEWLIDQGAISFTIERKGQRHSFAEFKHKTINRSFPFVKNTYGNSPIIASQIHIETFCPLAINDVAISSLPVLLLELKCNNPASHEETFNIIVRPESLFANEVQSCHASGYSGVMNTYHQLTCNSETQWKNGELIIPVSTKAYEQKTFHILLTCYDDNWISVNQFKNVGEITDYTHKVWSMLKEVTTLFGKAIPKTEDAVLDNYLRWYIIPAISLTKCTKNNEVLTMGYRELNQRDSYWTSWLHLVLFKDAERKMIEESIAYQQPSGKIPTTILPLIERNDDLDINAFFILRATRFYQYYHNKDELASHWSALKKAMDWLLARDCSGDGIPCQVSFWGDWKDVRGVEERKYSPFFSLIYLAALKQMIWLSSESDDEASHRNYEAAYQKGYDFINKSVEEGGLWNGNYYCQRWKDGTINNRLLQDQTIGILFDVIPLDKAQSIVNSLNTMSLTPYGIAETFPYYPANWGYAPATYHNGAVWPWLSFMDCWARLRIGKTQEAIDLVKRVANADLVASGDWSPNEHINSLTGQNLGFQLQGWNAGLFGLVYFGLIHPDIIP